MSIDNVLDSLRVYQMDTKEEVLEAVYHIQIGRWEYEFRTHTVEEETIIDKMLSRTIRRGCNNINRRITEVHSRRWGGS